MLSLPEAFLFAIAIYTHALIRIDDLLRGHRQRERVEIVLFCAALHSHASREERVCGIEEIILNYA